MKKRFIKCMLTAFTFGLLMSLNTLATGAEADSSIKISGSGNVTLMSDNAEQDGITALQLGLQIESEKVADAVFNFSTENTPKIMDYRYNKDTKVLTLYIADSEPIFKGSDSLNLGGVYATDADGNSVDAKISVKENSLKFVSQNNVTDKTYSVDDTEYTGGSNDGGDYIEIKKTFPTSYVVTIPDGTNYFAENQGFTVKADNVLIEYGQTLEVTVTSGNNWQLKDSNNPENPSGIDYRMAIGDSGTEITSQTQTIMSIGEGIQSDGVTLTVVSVDNPDMAGKFSDTLTFGVEINQ